MAILTLLGITICASNGWTQVRITALGNSKLKVQAILDTVKNNSFQIRGYSLGYSMFGDNTAKIDFTDAEGVCRSIVYTLKNEGITVPKYVAINPERALCD